MKRSKALVMVDASYWMYYTVFGAVAEFKKKAPEEASCWLKPAEEVDQTCLPDLLGCETFKRILKLFVMKRCETIDWHLKGHFQDKLDSIDDIDIVFAMDDFTSKSFRKALYPQYKAQRKLVPHQFDTSKVRHYVFNVIFKELELAEKHGYRFLSVPGAEADDVIAVAMQDCADEYDLKVLFASDHDFVQLDGVKQIDLFGRTVECKIAGIEVTPQEYLLGKLLLGDTSDNISKVFKGVGPKRVIALIRDREKLKSMLKESQDSAHRYMLNKKLIAFSEIPIELRASIKEAFSKAVWRECDMNGSANSQQLFANLEWL